MSHLRPQTALIATLAALLLSHLLLLIPAIPHEIETLAVLVFTWFVPGYWLCRAFLPTPPRTLQQWLEQILFAAGGGYVVQVLAMTLLSYAPGGVTALQTALTFDVVTLALIGAAWARRHATDPTPEPDSTPTNRTHILLMVGSLLVVSFLFRLPGLGYAEFQGDEARAILKSAAIIQGHEESLFLYRKGPTEIVVTTIGYALTGQLTEASARLPYALAGVLLPLAIFLLGWRLHSPWAGWLAGWLIALDGHFIGYARVAQYNTIDQLMSLLVLLLGVGLLQQRRHLRAAFALIALYMGVGLLSHYEVAQTAIPLLFIMWLLWRQGVGTGALVQSSVGAVLVGAATLLIFYVPFLLNPNIVNTLDYLSENLVENADSHFPYNHWGDFFRQSTFYSTTYLTLAWGGLTTLALAWAYQRRWGLGGVLAALLLLGGLVLGTVQPSLFVVAGYNLNVLWFAALMIGVWFTPMSQWMRLAWLWFAVLWGVCAFVTSFPSLHYIPAFLPSALIIGMTLSDLAARLRPLPQGKPLLMGAAVLGAVASIVVGLYTYRTFVDNSTEYVRTWDWRTNDGWTIAHEPDSIPVYGVPHQSGWKTVGMLYSMGILNGSYDTNMQEAIAEWYTRRPERCERSNRYFLLELREKPQAQEAIRARLAGTHHLAGIVLVRGEPRMEVYEVGAGEGATPWQYETNEYIAAFDSASAFDTIRLDTPAILPQPEVVLNYTMENTFVVEGYTIAQPTRQIGDFVQLTVYWRSIEKSGADYTAFTHLISTDDEQLYGQIDRRPGCTLRPTYQWNDGRQVIDHYEIPINEGAPLGSYVVRFGLYDSVTFARLPLLNPQGEPMGDAVQTEAFILE